ncbi:MULTISPECIES: CPBP family intramembrane glutamic endopeptidase [unclassified Curtobacterium]|uniref:CPBP family intramembrane glutamic endopeptidase n=1 Tax=unclassified Curtobacterium TaxID=257496 RepID=UPI000DA9531C|nr:MULTISPECIES: CPBP family intramembrane glutamic endopeptidase [unclassified Curtobacterium]PZE25347.1 CPBP family intramembrane metalloprotease domain-containing protein [Curtobacterium sp. MCBD17_028]PZE75371.1 CPBP family intramembrane metalloprotease domain-containing protein [Curtobacterium sp. MCBD17_019]PZF57985.1 CPBP family intramembrane metalloprotease domain-containing protein [Curtobacterium sp. MCBD17_034]PZF61405.1 CPBP family intramembrane metalloprotease domain-containing pro
MDEDVDTPTANTAPPTSRGRLAAEVVIVLALSLGASAVYSIVEIVDDLTKTTALASQTTTLNTSQDDRSLFDLLDQLIGVAVDLAPVALVAFLLWRSARPHLARLGIDRFRPRADLGGAAGLALLIGVPGLGLYFAGRALGITVDVVPTALGTYWWTVPVLLLSAIRSGLQEEVIVVGYLYERLGRLGWGRWTVITSTAVLRGSYHLYQGFGAFVGNAVMGIVFGWVYTRWGRLLPLVITHCLLDAAVFVGYPYVASAFPHLFGAH